MKQLSVLLDQETKVALKMDCIKKDVSASNIVGKMVYIYLNSGEKFQDDVVEDHEKVASELVTDWVGREEEEDEE